LTPPKTIKGRNSKKKKKDKKTLTRGCRGGGPANGKGTPVESTREAISPENSKHRTIKLFLMRGKSETEEGDRLWSRGGERTYGEKNLFQAKCEERISAERHGSEVRTFGEQINPCD